MVVDRRATSLRKPAAPPAEALLRSEPGGALDGGPQHLDRIVHERMRLGIVSVLALHDCLSFTELKAMLGATDGNLSVHARKLEEAGYVDCRKGYQGRVPRTEYRLTTSGRRALELYLDHMEALIEAVRET